MQDQGRTSQREVRPALLCDLSTGYSGAAVGPSGLGRQESESNTCHSERSEDSFKAKAANRPGRDLMPEEVILVVMSLYLV